MKLTLSPLRLKSTYLYAGAFLLALALILQTYWVAIIALVVAYPALLMFFKENGDF